MFNCLKSHRGNFKLGITYVYVSSSFRDINIFKSQNNKVT